MLPLQYSALFALRQWRMDLMTFQKNNENQPHPHGLKGKALGMRLNENVWMSQEFYFRLIFYNNRANPRMLIG